MAKSPKPKQADFDFYKALDLMFRNSKNVTKRSWNNTDEYGFRGADGRLKIHRPDGKVYDWILSEGDILGVDFYIL